MVLRWLDVFIFIGAFAMDFMTWVLDLAPAGAGGGVALTLWITSSSRSSRSFYVGVRRGLHPHGPVLGVSPADGVAWRSFFTR